MSKGQRGNKEAKKPKKAPTSVKTIAPGATPAPVVPAWPRPSWPKK